MLASVCLVRHWCYESNCWLLLMLIAIPLWFHAVWLQFCMYWRWCVYHPRMWHGNAFGHSCLSVCLCICLSVSPVYAVTFENHDLETPFLVYRYIFRICKPCTCSYTKVIWPRSRAQVQRTSCQINAHSRVVCLLLKGNFVVIAFFRVYKSIVIDSSFFE